MDRFVFVDAKFTNRVRPELLSIALVLDGSGPRDLYLELDLDSDAGRQRREAASDFVRENVLRQWGRVDEQCSLDQMSERADRWLLDLVDRASDVVYVSCNGPVVVDLFLSLLEASLNRPGVEDRLEAESFQPLMNKRVFRAAHASSLARSRRSDGIDEYHALAQARALSAGYFAAS